MILDTNNRRKVWIAIILGILTVFPACKGQALQDPWETAAEIAEGITLTSFPDRVFSIMEYGASADDDAMDWEAIKVAISKCAAAGGGRVLIPSGIYYTGPITLLSNVNLHLVEGAVLKFSINPEDYLPVVRTRWEGVDCYNYCPFIYANDQMNIAITGKGVLDGQANDSQWWWWKGRTEYGWKSGMPSQGDPQGRPKLFTFMENDTPLVERTIGKEGYLRPPFIQFVQCNTVLVEDITIKNSPFWLIHPLLSENIIIRGFKAMSHGPNNDGCNPESCKNVLIEKCYFNTGDDCIAIKSGRNEDGRRWDIPSENIIVRNCEMNDGHGGVVIGSEISGGCRNVFVENCLMDSPQLERAIRIKTNSLRGGIVENLFIRDIEVGVVEEAVIKINCLYEIKDGEHGDHPPIIRNIHLDNIISQKSEFAFFLQGISQETAISNIVIENSSFDGVKQGNFIQYSDKPVLKDVYINQKLVE